MKINKTIIDATKAPAAGDLWIWDTELAGFGFRVQASGRKTYVVRYRTNDSSRTQRKLTIGRCSDLPPERARGLARDVFSSVAAGNDPAAERKPAKAGGKGGVTFEGMLKARIVAMKARGRANASEVERVLLLAKHNAADFIGRDKHPSEVTSNDIVRFVSKHYKAGHRGAADKARGYLAAAFAWALKSANDYTVAASCDWGLKHNPASDVAKDHGAIKVRDRNLSAAEIRELWKACQDGTGGFSLEVDVCIRLILACGQRVQETLRLEGADLDLENNVWTMPAHKTKGGKHGHRIPLPAIIVPDLVQMKSMRGDGLLFPARRGSRSPTISPISVLQSIKRWLARKDTATTTFQTRDLRRTWKSRAHDAGVDRFTRDLIQQHAKSDTGSKNYDRSDYGPQMRDAMMKWSAWLDATLAA